MRRTRFRRREDEYVYKIVIEGVGDWVEHAYLPLLMSKIADLSKETANSEGAIKELTVYYVNDSRWKKRPGWVDGIEDWGNYLDKADPEDMDLYEAINPDAVFIATPDSTHSQIARHWLFKTPLVFIEKPFDSHINNVLDLLRERGRGASSRDPKGQYDTHIFGLDHWQFYALPIYELRSEIEKHLDGTLAEVVFFMTEDRAIELDRDRSLQHGLTLDLLPHLLALLTYFGDVRTIDEIRIFEAGQYEPLYAVNREVTRQEDITERFHTETFSRLKFTFQDYSETQHHVPCTAEVGKGREPEKKYMEVRGHNGNAIRVDFQTNGTVVSYPYNSLFFLARNPSDYADDPNIQCIPVVDPYDQSSTRILYILDDKSNPKRFLRQLERSRYRNLLDELVAGNEPSSQTGATAAASTLSLREGEEIVRALDFIWRAVQDYANWVRYPLPQKAYIAGV